MSASSSPSAIALGAYNPSQVPKPVLLAEFTARRGMMDDLLSILRGNQPGHPCQHSLLIGPRGFGKTTSLYALKYRLEDDPKLIKTWVPLLFDEENYHIADLAGFWLECLRLAEIALGQKGKETYDNLHTSRDPRLEDLAREAFLALLKKAKRRALLLVDNLNDVLAVVDDEESQHRLRAFLLEESQVCLVGTAASYFQLVSLSDRPFYNLFRVFRLDSFTVEEMKTALRAMADARKETSKHIHWPTQEGYWRGLHILTGGNPRLVKIIYQLMERGVTADFQAQLEGLLDAYTPYFKHRIEAMSPQQRRVFDAIALAWDSVQISDISPGLRMESNQISAQIKALTDAQLIAVVGGSTKRKLYHVADRFSNIYYFMRFSRAGRSRFEWFIRTMKIILTPDQYAKQLERMRELSVACTNGNDRKLQVHLLANAIRGIDDKSLRLDEGHKSVGTLLGYQHMEALQELLAEPAAKEFLDKDYEIAQWFAALPKEHRERLGYKYKQPQWWCKVTLAASDHGNWGIAFKSASKAMKLAPEKFDSWFLMSGALICAGKLEAAVEHAITALTLAKGDVDKAAGTIMLITAKQRMPQYENEARKIAIKYVKENSTSWSTKLICEDYFNDLEFCASLIDDMAHALSCKRDQPDKLSDHDILSIILEFSKTLLAANLDRKVRAVVENFDLREPLDLVLQAICVREDNSSRATLAPERLALVENYLAGVEEKKDGPKEARKSSQKIRRAEPCSDGK